MKELSELSAPKDIKRKRLEKDVQKQCVDWARARGYWARKFSSMTSTAEPDYLFARKVPRPGEPMRPVKLKFAVEFKRPGNTPTAAQHDEMETMRSAGWEVFWCKNFEIFQAVVLTLEKQFL